MMDWYRYEPLDPQLCWGVTGYMQGKQEAVQMAAHENYFWNTAYQVVHCLTGQVVAISDGEK